MTKKNVNNKSQKKIKNKDCVSQNNGEITDLPVFMILQLQKIINKQFNRGKESNNVI